MNESSATLSPAWRATLVAVGVVFIGLLVLFWSTAQGMVHIWYNYETYTHGFLILPISLWLVWQKRRHLAAYTPQPAPSLLLLVAAGLVVWVLARLTGVLVIEQAAFVGVVIVAVAAILGWQVSRFLAFPLLFLFLAVPMGEDLVPPMMEFTATFTVEALRLTGIPVYREGLWFSLPSGNWSVVEACSGVRYLIASFTLGMMYAYITYHTLWKRLLFVAMSVIVPVIANGIRAYIIVMIGHLSNMEYATGVDHLIYGWFFFGIVMFILFWIGSIWQEEQDPPAAMVSPGGAGNGSVGRRVSLIAVVTIALSAATVWATVRTEGAVVQVAAAFAAPAGAGDWQRTGEGPSWSAAHQPTPHAVAAVYRDGDAPVQLHVALYPVQRQDSEAINSQNRIADEVRRRVGLDRPRVQIGEHDVDVTASRVTLAVDGGLRDYLVWQWYRVAGRSLTNAYEGKLFEALARIYPGRADGAWIAIATPLSQQDEAAAQTRLGRFVQQMAPGIDRAIDLTLGLVE